MDTIPKCGSTGVMEDRAPAGWQPSMRQLPAIVVADKRRALRRRTDLPGYVTANDLPSKIDCRVCNLSATGAKLELCIAPTSALLRSLPEQFTLVLTHATQETHIECLAVRKADLEIGVLFQGPFQTVPKKREAIAPATDRR
jgi:hypothetical protein